MFTSASIGVSSRGKKLLCSIESSGSNHAEQCVHYGSATKLMCLQAVIHDSFKLHIFL